MIMVIAEIGVNWDGNFELVKEMMQHAKKADCNAIKFQAFQENLVNGHPEQDRLMRSAISKANIETINELARSVGIEWFCTPMYPEAVELLDPFVKRFKIRERDGKPLLENKTSKIIDEVLKTKKEVIVSSETSPRGTKFFNHPNINWLYCVPKYPCDLSDLDFRNLNDFSGFSNHCPKLIAPLTATILGSKILEIHITSDKSKDYVDNNVSFDYSELNELVSMIRAAEKIKKN